MSEVQRWEPENTALGYNMKPCADGSFVLFDVASKSEADLRQQLADVSNERDGLRAASQWIKCSDNPAPCDGRAVLLCWAINADGNSIDWNKNPESAGVFVQVASFWEGCGWTVYCSLPDEPRLHFKPTHWMPLPNPPTEQQVQS